MTTATTTTLFKANVMTTATATFLWLPNDYQLVTTTFLRLLLLVYHLLFAVSAQGKRMEVFKGSGAQLYR